MYEIPDGKTLFWFRRDLRLYDNAGLYHALKENKEVLPLFIFDTAILNDLDDPHDGRVHFIYNQVKLLKKELEQKGSSLWAVYGNPEEIFKKINPANVYTNHDYEPYARERDQKVERILKKNGIIFKSFKDQIIFEKDEILKNDGDPYTVFTPYMKKWKSELKSEDLESYDTKRYFNNLSRVDPISLPSLENLGFKKTDLEFPSGKINKDIIKDYDKTRNYPGIKGTSRLSIHLRFGTISIRELTKTANKLNETYLNELIWRNFFMTILWHFPHVINSSFKTEYDQIRWINNEDHFKRWCEGTTGFPIVDAGMRELNETGYMHNRVRMITASFLCKDLLIDWRWGEAYFAKKLLDYELSSNNGGWQWAAGTGCDAAPYFRIFNPELQSRKYDPENKYIKKWVPEYLSDKYSDPIIDHSERRKKALELYQKALNG